MTRKDFYNLTVGLAKTEEEEKTRYALDRIIKNRYRIPNNEIIKELNKCYDDTYTLEDLKELERKEQEEREQANRYLL